LRHHSANRDPRHAGFPALAGVAVLVATIATLTGCAGQATPVTPPKISAASPSAVQPVTSAKPVATAPHLVRSVPVRLQIAAIGVDSTLMKLGLQRDGTMQVPTGGFPAGWYTGGPTPGELGPAIIAGHVDMKGPGVFAKLDKLKPGNQVTVTRADGSKPVFRVIRVSLFAKDKFPTALVYGNTNMSVLRLITCGGTFNSQTGHYEDNTVAFAQLVPPAP
jgi:hypothetical protein